MATALHSLYNAASTAPAADEWDSGLDGYLYIEIYITCMQGEWPWGGITKCVVGAEAAGIADGSWGAPSWRWRGGDGTSRPAALALNAAGRAEGNGTCSTAYMT